MPCRTRKPCGLKAIRCTICLIDINEYWGVLPRSKASDKISEADINDIMFNSIPNGWSKQVYVQGFGCETITLKKAVNMSERMETAETIYEGVVESSDKKINLGGFLLLFS